MSGGFPFLGCSVNVHLVECRVRGVIVRNLEQPVLSTSILRKSKGLKSGEVAASCRAAGVL